MSKDRQRIADVINRMLENPDQIGVYPTSAAFDELEKYIQAERTQAMGWLYAEACRLLDAGQDLRTIEVSRLLARASVDLTPGYSEPKFEFSNRLTPAESERLAFLIEQASEVAQAACKILRHGFESSVPTGTGDVITNRVVLARELGELSFAGSLLTKARDVNHRDMTVALVEKSQSARKWLHYQGDLL